MNVRKIARQRMCAVLLAGGAALLWACRSNEGGPRQEVPPPPPQWHFEAMMHPGGDRTLTGVWGRSDGDVFVVGTEGLILRYKVIPLPSDEPPPDPPIPIREREREWTVMPSPTHEHLTAIQGIDNGTLFGLDPLEGEMFAVGWTGTILHFHPNPDADPLTDDGAWSIIAAPEGNGLTPVQKSDPACPDFDGDGISDDGDASGWIGDARCVDGNSAACDDNCRASANGPQRPLVDNNADGCLESGVDGPDLVDLSKIQRDADGDGLGEICDGDDTVADRVPRLIAPFFGVHAAIQGTQDLLVIAVGGDGAIATFSGPSAGAVPQVGVLPVTESTAWLTQERLSFRFDTDCPPGTPPGQTCVGSGRLPPSCPAVCSPLRTLCACPPNQGQCCDAGATTGLPAVPNACDAATGICQTLCPDCFRRLDTTLRSIAVDGTTIVAVGAKGAIFIGDTSDPMGVWRHPECNPVPQPLDEFPVLASVSAAGGAFHAAGSAGAVFRVNPGGGGCEIEPRTGAPSAFLSGAYAAGGNRAFVVGDQGLVLEVQSGATPQVVALDTGVDENFQAIWVDSTGGEEIVWVVGARGSLIRGAFF